MARKSQKPREYRFRIDAFSPETIPMQRLAQYLGDLARMMGESASVHFSHLESGSTVPVIRVDWEAEPKVRERLQKAKTNEGSIEARKAFKEINKRLVEDNATGTLYDPSKSKVISFPGREGANQVEFGPISQFGFFQGIPIVVGGKGDLVPVHLEDGTEKHIIQAPRHLAKQIANYLFTGIVRVEGRGRWIRNRLGDWEMNSFQAENVIEIQGGDIVSDLGRLRSIHGDWKKQKNPLRELEKIRTGRPN